MAACQLPAPKPLPSRFAGLVRTLLVTVVAAGALTAGAAEPPPGRATAAPDDRIGKLSPQNRAVAERMVKDMARLDAKILDRVGRLNQLTGKPPLESLQRETEDSIYDVRVTRGPVVEKAGRMLQEGKLQQPGRPTPPLVWGRFYSWDVHPQTPKVGMLHATLVLQFYEDGTGSAVGWLGIMNGTRVDADMEALSRMVDQHFAAAGVEPKIFRMLMMKGTEDTVTEFRRRPDPAGVSFYGPPVFKGDVAKSYDFVSTLFEKFTDDYLALVEKHQKDPGTAEDLARQDEMRKRWLVDQLFSDPYAAKLVPFEVWSFANVPPVIKF